MSTTVTCNNALVLTIPDGFREMTAEERNKLNMLEDGPGKVFTDPDRHIIVSVGWRPLGFVTSLLLGTKDAVSNMKTSIRRAMEPYDFHEGPSCRKALGSEKAEGFSYSYVAQDIGMYSEAYVAKHNKVFYYLYVYARAELKEESLRVWDEILASAGWV